MQHQKNEGRPEEREKNVALACPTERAMSLAQFMHGYR